MTISEKAAYLKGLMDGLNLDTEKAEGKMISAIVDLLADVTKKLTDVEEDLDEDYEEDDYGFDDEEEYEEGFDFGDEDSIIYEVKCACGNVINFDEETLEEGSIICDQCGETLEFSWEDDEDEEDEEDE